MGRLATATTIPAPEAAPGQAEAETLPASPASADTGPLLDQQLPAFPVSSIAPESSVPDATTAPDVAAPVSAPSTALTPTNPIRTPSHSSSNKRRNLAGAVALAVLSAGVGAYALAGRDSGDTVSVVDAKTGKTVKKPVQKQPLTLADVRGLLKAPAGYKPTKQDPEDDNDEGLCSAAKITPKLTPANSVSSYDSVGETGPFSFQSILVLPNDAAAVRYVKTATAGVPCSQKDKDGATTTFTKRAVQGSFNFTAVSIIPAAGVVDMVAVRNVVYANFDVALGGATETASHDVRSAAVIAKLKALQSTGGTLPAAVAPAPTKAPTTGASGPGDCANVLGVGKPVLAKTIKDGCLKGQDTLVVFVSFECKDGTTFAASDNFSGRTGGAWKAGGAGDGNQDAYSADVAACISDGEDAGAASGSVKCSDVVVDGKPVLQKTIDEGCTLPDGTIVAFATIDCADGRVFTTHDDRLRGFVGDVWKTGADGADVAYGKDYRACQG